LQVSTEKTIFMQKATYYVSRLIAARGILELTDRSLNFQVASFESSFGFKDLSIDIASIKDLEIEGGEFYPKVIVVTSVKRHEFVLAKAHELYDLIKSCQADSSPSGTREAMDVSLEPCDCGEMIRSIYRYCPWCGKKNG